MAEVGGQFASQTVGLGFAALCEVLPWFGFFLAPFFLPLSFLSLLVGSTPPAFMASSESTQMKPFLDGFRTSL